MPGQTSIPHGDKFHEALDYVHNLDKKGALRLLHYEHKDTMDEGLSCAYTPPDKDAIELLHKVKSSVESS